MRKNKNIILIVAAIIIIMAVMLIINITKESDPGEYDTFAKCLTEKGSKIYGASWCSSCEAHLSSP